MEDVNDQLTLADRVLNFDAPPEALDLLRAAPDQLIRFGIPPRPNPELEPQLYSVWTNFFAKKPIFVHADLALITDKFRPQLRRTSELSASTRYESSRNWCGAYIQPNNDKVFMNVSGQWFVPTPAIPPDAIPPSSGSVTYACSTWVGLDGQRRYRDLSLPQIGTWQGVTLSANSVTSVETYAWCQWWARDYGGNAPAVITSVPIHPMDEVICMVAVWSPSVAAVYVKNVSTTRLAHFRIRAPELNGYRFSISGATAEWIIERPAFINHPHHFYPLADYGQMEFTNCFATAANPAEPNWPQIVGASQKLDGGQLIQMYDLLPDPSRTKFISMVQKTSNRSAVISYGGFRHQKLASNTILLEPSVIRTRYVAPEKKASPPRGGSCSGRRGYPRRCRWRAPGGRCWCCGRGAGNCCWSHRLRSGGRGGRCGGCDRG